MRMYHGTIKEYAERIKQEGLKAMRRNQFNIRESEGSFSISSRAVETPMPHLAKFSATAEKYAHYRANYEKLPHGAVIPAEDWHREHVKLAKTKRTHATPAVIAFDLPDEWAYRHLFQDPYSNHAVVDVTVPAEFITEVKEL